MKKRFRYLALAVMATAAAVFTACNADSEWAQPLDSATPETRGDGLPDRRPARTEVADAIRSVLRPMESSYYARMETGQARPE